MPAIKLLSLIDRSLLLLEAEEKELPNELVVSERGYEFLKDRVADLNKKAAKYKVPSLEIEIIKEEMVKAIHPDLKKMQMDQPIIMPMDPGLLADPNSWVLVKQYTLRIKGEPPHIEGYEFIARLEHTPEGNFIYTNPKSSVPNLPSEYKSMNQHCDVCNTNRDRNDTFVVKMEQPDPVRFPGKLAGELLIVGRNCLQRFMPGLTVQGLVAWTNMIESMTEDMKAAQEMDDYGDGVEKKGSSGKYYETPENLLKYLAATYLYTGKYVSKKQEREDRERFGFDSKTESTLSRALSEMRPWKSKDPHKDFPIYYRLIEDEAFKAKVEDMMKEFDGWVAAKDFESEALKRPEFADYIHNLQLVAKQEYLRGNHFGFFSGLFQLFLREKKELEKKAEAAKVMAALPASPVTFDATLIGKRLRDIAKESEIKKLAAGGMDEKAIKKAIRGKEWGWEVTVMKVAEYERTNTFGYGDAGIGYRISFRDAFGNDFMWFASGNPGFQQDGKYIIDGTVTRYDPTNKYSGRPQTIINRVKIVKDYQHPDQPPQAEPGAEQPPAPPAPPTV